MNKEIDCYICKIKASTRSNYKIKDSVKHFLVDNSFWSVCQEHFTGNKALALIDDKIEITREKYLKFLYLK